MAALAIRNERVALEEGLIFITGIYLIFSIVDALSAPQYPWIFWFGLRVVTAALGLSLYFILRGRVPYATRNCLFVLPYFFTIEGIMIFANLSYSPYFAGLVICMFTVSWLFPMKWKQTLPMFSILALPSILFFTARLPHEFSFAVVGLSMSVGSVLFCVTNSQLIRREILNRLRASQALAFELANREEEVRQKVQEISKRKRFESQFSPQVIQHVLANEANVGRLNQESIVTVVFDIKDSSKKASELKPNDYAEVIEEIFDIVAASCLKWDVTIDKFTGDGAQAFAGAPKKHTDDLERTVFAASDALRMLKARHDYLTLRWKDPVELRIGIVDGSALVGFLGKGSLRSFTAIGSDVSLTHRVCAQAEPGRILLLSNQTDVNNVFSTFDYEKKVVSLNSLKGFEDREFKAIELNLRFRDKEVQNYGRCKECATPLVMVDQPNGIPKLLCPSCNIRGEDGQVKVFSNKP